MQDIKELVFEAFADWPELSPAWTQLVKLVGRQEAQRLLDSESPRRVRMLDLDNWEE